MTLIKTRRRGRRGQALVEMALVLPILLGLSLLIIQFGIIMNTAAQLTNLSREGARYAATQPALDAPIKARILDVAPNTIRDQDLADNKAAGTGIVITPAQGAAERSMTGYLIKVQITYNMRNKLFLPSTWFGVQIFSTNYVTQTTMMIE